MKLGDRVREMVTKFEGIVTGKAEYISGCVQYLVVAESLDNDGKVRSEWWDEIRLMVVEESAFTFVPSIGGPVQDQPRGMR